MTVGEITRIGPYLQVVETAVKAGAVTKRWTVHSGNVPDTHVGDLIGEVTWYAPWRRYTFEPPGGTVFDGDCLSILSAFMKNMTEDRKAERKKK